MAAPQVGGRAIAGLGQLRPTMKAGVWSLNNTLVEYGQHTPDLRDHKVKQETITRKNIRRFWEWNETWHRTASTQCFPRLTLIKH